MNPTTTEHDYRFPRRPGGDAAAGHRSADRFDTALTPTATASSTTRPTAAATTTPRIADGGHRAALHQFGLDLPADESGAHHELLRASVFPPFQQCVASEAQRLDEMQKEDPLAAQVWRFYAQTKLRLPAKERMENLTWRMMHFKLPKAGVAESAK